jgi:CheY-like chemotaxis protein
MPLPAPWAINGIPLIALTGYGQPEDRRRAAEAGFRTHVVKPVFRDSLLRTLASVLTEERQSP